MGIHPCRILFSFFSFLSMLSQPLWQNEGSRQTFPFKQESRKAGKQVKNSTLFPLHYWCGHGTESRSNFGGVCFCHSHSLKGSKGCMHANDITRFHSKGRVVILWALLSTVWNQGLDLVTACFNMLNLSTVFILDRTIIENERMKNPTSKDITTKCLLALLILASIHMDPCEVLVQHAWTGQYYILYCNMWIFIRTYTPTNGIGKERYFLWNPVSTISLLHQSLFHCDCGFQPLVLDLDLSWGALNCCSQMSLLEWHHDYLLIACKTCL